MKKRQWKRILKTARLCLAQAVGEPQTFCVRWLKCKIPERYLQRVYQAPDVEFAIKQAPVIAGFEADGGRTHIVPLDEAFSKTLAASRRRDRAAEDFKKSSMSFVAFLVERHPNIANWNQLARLHIRQYDESIGAVSPNRRRLLLQPLVQTDGYMAREFGFERIAEGLNLSNATVRKTCRIHLTDALAFVDYLRDNAQELEAPAALQAFAGMRLEEVYRLTWDKIDLRRGLVEISSEVKNKWSERLIPVCKRVLEALERARQRRGKIQSIHEDALVTGYADAGNYSKGLTNQISKWNDKIDWRPGDLRNLLPTWATSNSCIDALWEQYIGHAPAGVTARHYVPRLASASDGEQEETDAAMDLFRKAITKRLDDAIVEAQIKRSVKDSGVALSASEKL
jgi:integrase